MRAVAVLAFATTYGFGFAACSQAGQLNAAMHAESDMQQSAVTHRAELEVLIASEDLRTLSRTESLGESEQREIYFYDTPELELFNKGVLLRTRKLGDGAADSTVLSRSGKAIENSASHMRCAQEGISTTNLCSLRRDIDGEQIDEVAAGRGEVTQLFSKSQLALARRILPNVYINGLSVFGPIQGRVWKPNVKDIDGTVTLEEWMLPNGASVVTLSVRTAAASARDTLVDLRKFLDERGVREIANPGKTETALGYFASTLE